MAGVPPGPPPLRSSIKIPPAAAKGGIKVGPPPRPASQSRGSNLLSSADRRISGANAFRTISKQQAMKLRESIDSGILDPDFEYFYEVLRHRPRVAAEQVVTGMHSLHDLLMQLHQLTESVVCHGGSSASPRGLMKDSVFHGNKKGGLIEKDAAVRRADSGLSPAFASGAPDLMTGFLEGAAVMYSAYVGTGKSHARFLQNVKMKVIPILQEFFDKNYEAMIQSIQDFEEKQKSLEEVKTTISAQRTQCIISLCELKELDELALETTDKDKAKNAEKKRDKQRDATAKQFEDYEKAMARSKAAMIDFNTDILPCFLKQLEQRNSQRMKIMVQAMQVFKAQHVTFVQELQKKASKLSRTFNEISVGTELAKCLKVLKDEHGLPPAQVAIQHYGLPCMSSQLKDSTYGQMELFCKLRVSITEAKGLVRGDNIFSVLKVRLAEDKESKDKSKAKPIAEKKTPTAKRNGDSAIWLSNSTFKLDSVVDIQRMLMDDKTSAWKQLELLIRVWEQTTLGGPNFLGEVKIKLSQVEPGVPKDTWHLLTSNPTKTKVAASGQLCVNVDMETQEYMNSKPVFQFGKPLDDITCVPVPGYMMAIPDVLESMKAYLLQNGGTQVEGIFRLAPDGKACEQVKRELNMGTFDSCADVNCVSNLIKVWFRDLPKHDKILAGCQLNELVALEREDSKAVGKYIANMESSRQKSILLWLLDLCLVIGADSAVNKMTFGNLAIVIGPNLIPEHFGDSPAAFTATCAFLHHAMEWRAEFCTCEKSQGVQSASAAGRARSDLAEGFDETAFCNFCGGVL